jgi:hypothetical protein
MIVRRRAWLLGLCGAFLVGGTAALARRVQQPGGELTAGDTLNAPQTVQQANEYMGKMRATLKRVQKLQDQARAKKDVIKLNCVSDKLVQVTGHMAVADQSFASLNAAVARTDEPSRKHELTRMTILYQKVTVLGTEAENCIGEDASYVGETRVDIEVDPNIPNNDPTEPQLPLPDVTRPPEASPFI